MSLLIARRAGVLDALNAITLARSRVRKTGVVAAMESAAMTVTGRASTVRRDRNGIKSKRNRHLSCDC